MEENFSLPTVMKVITIGVTVYYTVTLYNIYYIIQ